MDDKIAARVWEQFSQRITTQGVAEATALIQFSTWVGLKAGTLAPSPKVVEDESDEE